MIVNQLKKMVYWLAWREWTIMVTLYHLYNTLVCLLGEFNWYFYVLLWRWLLLSWPR